MVRTPETQVTQPPFPDARERRRLLQDRNRTARDYPRDSIVPELFEARVDDDADAVAAVFDGQALSYSQLNAHANRLGHYLRAQGVGPEIMVGVCLERGLNMVVALLGILKAGGAYVPLDPDYPKSRLTFMLEDAQVPVLLTESALKDRLPALDGRRVYLDTDWPVIQQQPADNPAHSAKAENLAYVIYTSGSTGRPKGVAVPHRAISRLVCNTDYFQVTANDCVAQASNVSFDAATFEIWGALLNGARLAGVGKHVLLSPSALSACLDEQGVTAMFITTALFNLMAREAPQVFSSLRGLLFGGEAVDPQAVRRVLDAGPPEQLLHVYGPTESTTFASWYRVEQVPDEAVTVPIGSPLANTRLYVLDTDRQPVPVGVAGELYIGGDGLARGYLGQPELTEETFVADPFSGNTLARMYRTGDQVRYRHDGAIEFLGRFDHQVKIRGFRIEPGEIEAMLKRCSGVDEAVVLAHRTEHGDHRLAAYLVLQAGGTPTTGEMRGFIEEILPDYMIPSCFIVLDALPLTPNGKLDRQALPDPDWSGAHRDSAYEPPRNPVEKQLAGIYADVLGLDRAGIRDNFLELGAHSLNVTQLVARVRNIFHVELPLKSVFEHPVLGELAEHLKRLAGGDSTDEPFDIEPLQPGEPIPLSYSQERVWFLQQLHGSGRAYNLQATIRWHGCLDVAALEKSLTEIIRRHQILRTTFIDDNGSPVQCIHGAAPVRLDIVEPESCDTAAREQSVEKLIQNEFERLFDLGRLPLIRWRLIKLGEAEYLMTHVEHHLIHDGWSFNVFLGELMKLYTAYHQGEKSPLPEPVIQFADFARWQRRWMQGEEAARQLDYWKTQLAGSPPLLELPYDRPRPAVQRFHGAAPRFELPAPLCEGIDRLCRRAGVTPFITFMTGLFILLSRYSSQHDICIGTGMANRRWQEMEGLIGMIINNVVLRADLSDNPDILDLLGRVRDCTLDASVNQDLPFEKVVEALQPERSLSYNPLFQVMLGIHDSPMSQLELPDLTAEVDVGLATGGAKFDLTVIIVPGSARRLGKPATPGAETWSVIWEYNTDLFDASSVERMIAHYQRILQEMTRAPDTPIARLPLLDAAERRRLLVEWNRTGTDYPRDATVHALFEEQAARSPDATAVEHQGQRLSYRELNRLANRLAHRLIRLGVGPEVPVAICMVRSPELIAGLLAILKAGGAYLPLDPEYPEQRLRFMLDDSRAPVVVTSESLYGRLSAFGRDVVTLDHGWSALASESVADPRVPVTSASLAYLMYTSGSTGEPKGTCIEHRSVVRLVQSTDYVEFGPDEVFLQFAPVTFDASTFEIWGSLLHGSRLVVYPARDPALADLGGVIRDSGITTLWLTAGLFHQMVDGQPESLKHVRQLLAGGEALSVEHVNRARELLGKGSRIINGYGPTENTTFTCCYPMTAETRIGHTVPIGRPIANTRVYVLDEYLQPVPVGVAGELCIGGDGLARGYLNRPALTAECFVPAPFSEEPGARLYRSGDRVRYREDGVIEFLGRRDQQIKLHGFRIEPGEVESVLGRHPDVRDAAVIVQQPAAGDRRLTAYLIGCSDNPPSVRQLRDYLAETLPRFMLPSAFIWVDDAWPLTPNGKLDREALPLPDQNLLRTDAPVTLPRTDTERTIADLWSEVLPVSEIGVYDDFFAAGGHSLLAGQLMNRLRDVFGLEIPVRCLFEDPTVAGLAAYVEAARWRTDQAPAEDGSAEHEQGQI